MVRTRDASSAFPWPSYSTGVLLVPAPLSFFATTLSSAGSHPVSNGLVSAPSSLPPPTFSTLLVCLSPCLPSSGICDQMALFPSAEDGLLWASPSRLSRNVSRTKIIFCKPVVSCDWVYYVPGSFNAFFFLLPTRFAKGCLCLFRWVYKLSLSFHSQWYRLTWDSSFAFAWNLISGPLHLWACLCFPFLPC